MDDNKLIRLALHRFSENSVAARCLDESSEIVVFGSRSVGLERTSSDLDILCIGKSSRKLKTPSLDLIVMRSDETNQANWLGNELASHIARYGTWIKGRPLWVNDVQVGSEALGTKGKRIAAFLRALPSRWNNLDDVFRQKYAKKLRRETQRYLLLQRGIAVPPTRILDESWNVFSIAKQEVERYLVDSMGSDEIRFRRDLLKRITKALDDQASARIDFEVRR
jgi:hypothetical protein